MLKYLCVIRAMKREASTITSQNIIGYLQHLGVKIIYSDSEQDKPFLRATKLLGKAKATPSFAHQFDGKTCIVIKHRLPETDLQFLLLHELGHIQLGHNLAGISVKEEAAANSFAKWCLVAYRFPRRKTIIKSVSFVAAVFFMWAGISFAHDNTTVVYITTSGEKYHTSNCAFVREKDGVREISLAAAKKGHYTPCTKCF